jgi:tetratricopeptide (TPR) repeat protein
MALVAAGKPEEALQELEAETRISPQSALAYVQIASLRLQGKHSKQALPPARKAVLLAPQSSSSHEVLAQTLKALGEAQEAAKESALVKKLEGRPVKVDVAQRQQYGRSRLREKTAQSANAMTSSKSEDSFETLTQKGAAAQAAGQIDVTLSYYQRALALRPEWAEGWMNLGTIYYASAHYPEAIAALKNAAAINERNGNVWALLGLSEFETKDYKNSLIHLERGQDLGLASDRSAMQIARYHLAILLNRNGEFDRATDLLTPESGSGPLAEPVKFALGISLLHIRSFPEEVDPASNALVRVAGETAALLSESKYDLAFAKFEQLLQMNSRVPYLHYAYGTALASASRYDEAEKQFAEESVITPSSALPYLRRGAIALQLRHAEEAAQLAAHAVQLAPESGEGHYLSGRSLLELGKTTDALHELETARTLAPNSPEVRFSLARAYTKAGKPEAAEQERAAFERLNAMVQSQRSQTGSQAYGAIQSQNGIRAAQPSSQPENRVKPD